MHDFAIGLSPLIFYLVCHLALAVESQPVLHNERSLPVSALNRHIGKSSLYGLSGSGDIIFLSDSAGYKNAYRLSLPDKQPSLLFRKNFFNHPIARIYPLNDEFIFMADTDGNEFYQLYYTRPGLSSPLLLTDGKSRNQSVVWSRSGHFFAYSNTSRNGHDMDVYIRRVDSSPVRITTFDGSWFPVSWSPDGDRLAINRYISENESIAYIYDIRLNKFIFTFPSGNTVNYQKLEFTEDGTKILFLSRSNNNFINLQLLDLVSHKISNLTRDIKWDVENFVISKTGHVYFTTNENGYSRINTLNLMTRKNNPLRTPQVGVIYNLLLSRDQKQLFYSGGSINSPTSIYKLTLASQKNSRLLPPGFEGGPTGKIHTRLITYRSGIDHRLIPAFVSQPSGAGPFPVVINVHGGPEYQARPEFNALNSYLVNNMHIIVIQPNIRGSSGYGVNYMNLDNGINRQSAIADIGDLLTWVQRNKNIKKNKIILTGGSYGGYVVLDSLTIFPNKICAGIDLMGSANLITYLENTQDYRKDLRRKEYGDERIPSVRRFMSQTAPVNNITKITSSLLIVGGVNDPRVPFSESLSMYQALKSTGHDVTLIKLSREGHFINGAVDRANVLSAQVNFINKELNLCR
ncbi:prolyl oligopeptidase family serine peptidase [Kosakonia sp. MUSA4]|uniref:S9 family peptidase n=1 Tax=Kosakonia sp. MUSA4 TaxID=2067958 RepID=UPI001ABF21CD|nr:prolyl oligopeptidase family serine peptidase [Kosakonia sp. MUSA4]